MADDNNNNNNKCQRQFQCRMTLSVASRGSCFQTFSGRPPQRSASHWLIIRHTISASEKDAVDNALKTEQTFCPLLKVSFIFMMDFYLEPWLGYSVA